MKIIEENVNYSIAYESGKGVEAPNACRDDCASDDGGCPNFCDWEWGW